MIWLSLTGIAFASLGIGAALVAWYRGRGRHHAERLKSMLPPSGPAHEALSTIQQTHAQIKEDVPAVREYSKTFSRRLDERERRILTIEAQRAALLRESHGAGS